MAGDTARALHSHTDLRSSVSELIFASIPHTPSLYDFTMTYMPCQRSRPASRSSSFSTDYGEMPLLHGPFSIDGSADLPTFLNFASTSTADILHDDCSPHHPYFDAVGSLHIIHLPCTDINGSYDRTCITCLHRPQTLGRPVRPEIQRLHPLKTRQASHSVPDGMHRQACLRHQILPLTPLLGRSLDVLNWMRWLQNHSATSPISLPAATRGQRKRVVLYLR